MIKFAATQICRAMLLSVLALGAAQAETGDPLDKRVQEISHELRCLVCQNQSIAESDADLARDLKRQVREMLVAGKDEAEIYDYMVARYGDFVLYQPPVRDSTLLLWLGPALLLLAAGGGFAWAFRQRRSEQARSTLSPSQLAEARNLLNDEGKDNAAPSSPPDSRT